MTDGKKERIPWIDICRLLAMTLVVWLHFGAPRAIDSIVHLCHIPVFFVLTGLCLNTGRTWGGFIARRAKGLLVPYLSFGILFWLVWSLIHLAVLPERVYNVQDFLSRLFLYNTDTLPWLWGAVQWFLTCLFFAELICFALIHLAGSAATLACTVAFALMYLYLVPSGAFRLPLALDTALVAAVFVAFGHQLRGAARKLERWPAGRLSAFAALLSAVLLIVWRVNGTANMRAMEY